QMYGAQNKGGIPGSPLTTARFAFKDPATGAIEGTFNANNFPSVTTIFDWEAPIAKSMGIKFDEGGSAASRASRFNTLRDAKVFTCPENDVIAQIFNADGLPNIASGRMISYNTALAFLVQAKGSAGVTAGFSG